jgi:hypothetical protein
MAKYLKTVDIWTLTEDQIKTLQPGQWVTAGGSRGVFCGVKPSGSVVVAWKSNMDSHRDPGAYLRALLDYAKAGREIAPKKTPKVSKFSGMDALMVSVFLVLWAGLLSIA